MLIQVSLQSLGSKTKSISVSLLSKGLPGQPGSVFLGAETQSSPAALSCRQGLDVCTGVLQGWSKDRGGTGMPRLCTGCARIQSAHGQERAAVGGWGSGSSQWGDPAVVPALEMKFTTLELLCQMKYLAQLGFPG